MCPRNEGWYLPHSQSPASRGRGSVGQTWRFPAVQLAPICIAGRNCRGCRASLSGGRGEEVEVIPARPGSYLGPGPHVTPSTDHPPKAALRAWRIRVHKSASGSRAPRFKGWQRDRSRSLRGSPYTMPSSDLTVKKSPLTAYHIFESSYSTAWYSPVKEPLNTCYPFIPTS